MIDFNIQSLLFVLEVFVLIVLFWHIRELAQNSKEIKKNITEIHKTHTELHQDTRALKEAVDRLEKDLQRGVDHGVRRLGTGAAFAYRAT